MTDKRVCLVTPGHLATNPRVVKEADALSAAGYRVEVVCADYVAWARSADREFAGRPWKVRRKLRFGPQAPLPTYLLQTLRRRSAGALFGAGLRARWIAETAFHPLVPALNTALSEIEADLYVAHYVAALPATAHAAAKFGGKLAFDAEDYHLGEFPESEGCSRQKELLRRIEADYLPACAYVTAASPGIAEAYARTYGVQATPVLNAFPRSQAPLASTDRGECPHPSVYWFSQTIGPNRGLECAVRAIGLSRACPHLYLRGTVSPDYAARLLAISSTHGSEERLHFLELAAPGSMEQIAAQFDVGLAAEPGWTENNSLALSNKVFTYLSAGIPTVGSSTKAHIGLAQHAPGAIFVYRADDPEDLAKTLDLLLLSPGNLRAARAAAWQLGQTRFSWDQEKGRLIACVDEALGVRR
jgi:glycosyltransferase involved in cell wall biosynthesis